MKNYSILKFFIYLYLAQSGVKLAGQSEFMPDVKILSINEARDRATLNVGPREGFNLGDSFCTKIKSNSLPVCLSITEIQNQQAILTIPLPYQKHIDTNQHFFMDSTWTPQPSVSEGKSSKNTKIIQQESETPAKSNSIPKPLIHEQTPVKVDKKTTKLTSVNKANKKESKPIVQQSIQNDLSHSQVKTHTNSAEISNVVTPKNAAPELSSPVPSVVEKKEDISELSKTLNNSTPPESEKKSTSVKKKSKKKPRTIADDTMAIELYTIKSLRSPIQYQPMSFKKQQDLNTEVDEVWNQRQTINRFDSGTALAARFEMWDSFLLRTGFRMEEYASNKFVADYATSESNLFTSSQTKISAWGVWTDYMLQYELWSWNAWAIGLGLDYSSNTINFTAKRQDEISKEISLLASSTAKINFFSFRVPIETRFELGPVGIIFSYVYAKPMYFTKNEILSEIGIPSEIKYRRDSEEEFSEKFAPKAASSSSSLLIGFYYNFIEKKPNKPVTTNKKKITPHQPQNGL